MGVVKFIINAIFWIWLFMVPAGSLGLIAFFTHKQAIGYLFISIIITAVGALLGYQLAEYVRKKYGLDGFFGKLLSTPELDENSHPKSSS